MRDIYRELLKRSMEDVVKDVKEIEETQGVKIPPEVLGMMCSTLYHQRMRDWNVKWQDNQYPENDMIGRQ